MLASPLSVVVWRQKSFMLAEPCKAPSHASIRRENGVVAVALLYLADDDRARGGIEETLKPMIGNVLAVIFPSMSCVPAINEKPAGRGGDDQGQHYRPPRFVAGRSPLMMCKFQCRECGDARPA